MVERDNENLLPWAKFQIFQSNIKGAFILENNASLNEYASIAFFNQLYKVYPIPNRLSPYIYIYSIKLLN